MTVIAWDGKKLAADRRGEIGWAVSSRTKIHRHDGMLMGGAGRYQVVCAIIQWIKDGRDPAKWPACADFDADTIVMLVDRARKVWIYESGPHTMPLRDKFFAIGSGAEAARAAMHCGCDARRAVAVASTICKGCGGGIDVLTLEHP